VKRREDSSSLLSLGFLLNYRIFYPQDLNQQTSQALELNC